MRPPYSILFISTLFLSTMMVMSSSHWIYLWMSLELNMLSFIAIMNSNQLNQTTEATIKYFIVQATGSILFLLASITFHLLSHMSFSLLMLLSILMKMGAAPFHFWFPPVASSLNWNNLILLITWQKLAPLGVLSSIMKWSSPEIPMLMASMSAIIGGCGGIGQSQLRSIIAFSSIGHLGWMIALAYTSPPMLLIYFGVYCLMNIPLLSIFNLLNLKSMMEDKPPLSNLIMFMMTALLLSLAGIPPLSGFSLKWMSIQIITTTISSPWIILLIVGSLMSLFFYLNILFIFINTSTSPLQPTFMLKQPWFFISMALLSLFLMDFILMLS